MPAALIRPSAVRDGASEQEIIAILSGERRRPRDPSSFTYVAMRHVVAPLLVRAGIAELLPPGEASRLQEATRKQAVITALREREIGRVLEALHDDGLDVLVIKGAYVANTCYAESYLRTRDDTDLLIRAGDREAVSAALARLGYARQSIQTGDAVLGQMMFDRSGAIGAALDVHWRVARPHLVDTLFDFDDLLSRAVPIPRLSAHARGPGPVDALALTCVHQAAHHGGRDLLLWTYDVHLLLRGFAPEDVDAFVGRAIGRRMAAVCAAAIEPAQASFPHPAANAILDRLRGGSADEPSAALLQPRGWVDDLRMDLRALRSWRARGRLIAGHLFPPAAYMRETYAPSSRASLPWLYGRRVVRGLRRWYESRGIG